MDKESLALTINGFDKKKFEQTVKIVLKEVFKTSAENDNNINSKTKDVDTSVLYHLFLDKNSKLDSTVLKEKINKFNIQNIYFCYKYNVKTAESVKNEVEFGNEYKITVKCIGSSLLAELIIENNLVSKIYSEDAIDRQIKPTDIDYLTAAFHSFTIASSEVNELKGNVYDDAILFKISSSNYHEKKEITKDVLDFLNLPSEKEEIINNRIDSFLTRKWIQKNETGFNLSSSVDDDIKNRKQAYLQDLSTLTSAQIDLMRNKYRVEWNDDDSKEIATYLAFYAIDSQIKILREARTKLEHPIFKLVKDGNEKLLSYLRSKKGLDDATSNKAVEDLVHIAERHSLIIKITRACLYIALEGSDPLSSAQSLGASHWNDFHVMLEPTVAIPFICSRLYITKNTKSFEKSVKSVNKAIELTSKVAIPHSYINECAGHLLTARKYLAFELDPHEMEYSSNAFVSNYYSEKNAGTDMPHSLMEYLATFSSAIRTEKNNIKAWVREIMVDLTELLTKGQITQEIIPSFNDDALKDYENNYSHYLSENNKTKPNHLIRHDATVLKYTNDRMANNNEHWIILSYDVALTKVGNQPSYKGWICSPEKFLEMTYISDSLSEAQMVSIIHSIASISQNELSIGAKIMDRIVAYASPNMQNWKFKQELDTFKKEMKARFNNTNKDFDRELIVSTDNFLKEKGININEEDMEVPTD